MIRSARVAAISANEWRIVRKYPEVVILLVVVPLVMTVVIANGLGAVQSVYGRGGNGADVAVPGMTLMFGFMLVGFLGNGFVGERGWGTWDRLRASSVRPSEVMVGKVLPYAGLSLGQFVLMFLVGGLLLGLRVNGSWLALALLVLASVLLILSVALAVTAFATSPQQVSSFANLVGLVFGLLGGVFMPVIALPSWIRWLSPVMPQYWAMRGFDAVLAGSGGVADVAVELVVLVAVSAVLFAVALLRFRAQESRRAIT